MRTSIPRLSIVVVVMGLLATVSAFGIYSTVANSTFEDETSYVAIFEDVSGLRQGADVVVAGVSVGRVSSLDLTDDAQVRVEFTVAEDVPVTTASTATVRYKDLLGRRDVEIQQGSADAGRLRAGATIPTSRTAPALDLDQLYNGFQPVFEGLDAQEVNDLSGSLIAVMQNQGETVDHILARTASLTETVADKDAAIGSLVKNLDAVLTTVAERTPETEQTVDNLQALVSGLSDDRKALADAVTRIGGSTDDLAALVGDVRPELKGDIAQVRRLSAEINADEQDLRTLFARAPGYYALVGRVGIYQSAFQFYLCGAQVRIEPPGGGPAILTEMTRSQERRCQS